MVGRVTVIVVNYESGPCLRRCVEALRQAGAPFEIIIVDNNSRDESLSGLGEFAGLLIIKNPMNVGFAAACNIGARHAQGEDLLFLNPDCEMAPDAIARLHAVLHSSDGGRIGMVGGLLLNPDGSEQTGGRRAFPTPWRAFVRAVGLWRLRRVFPRWFADFSLEEQALPNEPVPVDAISGACMLVKREALEDVGLWDEGYFLHCEDLDWCMRFHQKGWKVLFVPDAKVTHVKGASSRSRPVFVEWHKHKGMLRFYRKFYRQQYPALLWPLVVLGVWLRFALVASYHTVRRLLARGGVARG